MVFVFGMLALSLGARAAAGTWAAPGALFCAFWFVFTFVPLVALPGVPINPLAVLYILAGCLAFSLPIYFGATRDALATNATLAPIRRRWLAGRTLRVVFHATFVISVVFLFVDVAIQGFSLEDLVFNFFKSANTYLDLRYEGEIEVNPFGQGGLIAAYLCVTFGAIVHAQTPPSMRRHVVLLASLTPAVLVMLLQSAKGLFFLSIAIILGVNLFYRVLADRRPHIDAKAALNYAFYGLLAIPLIVLSFLTRGLYAIDDSGELADRLTSYLASYAFLHLFSFSDWFSYLVGDPSLNWYELEPPTFGFFTFVSLFKLLGNSHEVLPGTYDDYFAVGDLSPGNLYTIFRGLITDFGLAGGLVVVGVFGWVFHAAFEVMLRTRRPAVSLSLMLTFVHFLYTSYMISAFIWNATWLVNALCAVILLLNSAMTRMQPLPRAALAT